MMITIVSQIRIGQTILQWIEFLPTNQRHALSRGFPLTRMRLRAR
jgi:hypothetical protein